MRTCRHDGGSDDVHGLSEGGQRIEAQPPAPAADTDR
jgi:hypothetical protein